MKNVLVFTFCMILLVGNVSALNWDNSVDYENNNMTVIITNWFGFGEKLGEATLTSHKTPTEIKDVLSGEDRAVMYYEFNEWETYTNGLGEVIFKDMKKGGEEIEKDYYFAKAVYEETIYPHYKTECNNNILQNGSIEKNCIQINTENKTKRLIKSWERLETNEIPSGSNTIGLITEVKSGDYIDGIWTIAGKQVARHASWLESYNINLVTYINFSETGASFGDVTGNNNNASRSGTASSTTGIIGNGVEFDGTAGQKITLSPASPNFPKGTEDFTFRMWIRPTTITCSGGGGADCGLIYDNANSAKLSLRIQSGGDFVHQVGSCGAANVIPDSGGWDFSSWYHIVFRREAGNVTIWKDAVLQGETECISSSIVNTGYYLGTRPQGPNDQLFVGDMDEFAISNQTAWSDQRIIDDYNGGVGMTYTNIFDTIAPNVTANNPTNTTYGTTILFNVTAVDPKGISSCKYTLNNGKTNYTMTNATTSPNDYTDTNSTMSKGNLEVKYFCEDVYGNENNSISTSFYVDNIAPNVTANNPTNDSFFTRTITFNVTSLDNFGMEGCNYSLDNGASNFSMANVTTSPDDYTDTNSTMSVGSHNVTYFCEDVYGNENNSISTSFFIDNIAPNVTINNPTNDSFFSTSITFNVTALDNPGIDTCRFTLDNGASNFTMANVSTSPNDWTFTNTTMQNGSHNATFFCNDTLNNKNNTESISFFINTEPPIVNLIVPANNTRNILNNDTFNCNTNDTVGVIQVDLIIDGVINISITNTTAGENLSLNLTVHNLSEGFHTWTCNSSNGRSLLNGTGDLRTFETNTTSDINFFDPTPANNSNLNVGIFGINLSLTETYFANMTIRLFNSTGIFNTTLIIDGTRFINYTEVPDGNYNYNVTIKTTTGTDNVSETRQLIIDTSLPAINITSPRGEIIHHFFGDNLTLNWSVSDDNLQTCWYEYNSTNTTLTCGDNNFSFLPTSQLNLTFYANDSFGNEQSNFTEWTFLILEKPVVFNSSTFETEQETFILNVSSSGTYTITAEFFYNNISQGESTKTGNNINALFTSIIDIPTASGNVSFYWTVSVGSTLANTTSNNQLINNIIFGLCNSSLTTTYLNFTFQDETGLTSMNASNDLTDFTYWMGGGSGSVTKNYITTNTTENPEYVFCFDPSDKTMTQDLDFKYSASGYPIRTFSYDDIDLTNTSTLQTLYLLSSSDGIYSSISIIETSGVVIDNVVITVEREINGIWKLVGQSTTGSDGLSTFWVNPNFQHRITAVKTGYITSQVTITPSQSLYTLTMGTITGNASYVSDIPGIKWTGYPNIGTLEPGLTEFNVTITSSESNLENCKFELVNATNSSQVFGSSTSLTNSSHCFLSIVYTTIENNNLFGIISVDTTTTTGFVIIDTDLKWTLIERVVKDWRTVKNFIGELNDIGEFGYGNEATFSRLIFFFIITTIIIGMFNFYTGLEIQSPGASIVIVFVIIFFASLGGFLTFDYSHHVDPGIGSFIEQWGFAYLAGLSLINVLLWRKRQV